MQKPVEDLKDWKDRKNNKIFSKEQTVTKEQTVAG